MGKTRLLNTKKRTKEREENDKLAQEGIIR